MKAALDIFRASTIRVKNLEGLHGAITSLTTAVVDPSDLLRAQIVLTVSALDYFIHELTVRGMLQVFNSTRAPTAAFNRQKVSGSLLIGASAGSAIHFEEDVRQRHSLLTFQQPDKIADAIRLFSDKPLWQEVATRFSKPENAIKTNLRLIVERRNKIAHEADIDPSFPGQRWPITSHDTSHALTFIEGLCEAIYEVVK